MSAGETVLQGDGAGDTAEGNRQADGGAEVANVEAGRQATPQQKQAAKTATHAGPN